MATAGLRAVLVIAAVVLGVFVLSRAFPTGGEATIPTTPDQAPTSPAPTSPAPTGDQGGGNGGGGAGQPEAHDPSEIRLQILNGTDVSGLAADTQVTLEEQGYRVVTVGDAQDKPVERTTISFKRDYRADARVLRDQLFADAQLETAAPDADAHITITLGTDYAESQGA